MNATDARGLATPRTLASLLATLVLTLLAACGGAAPGGGQSPGTFLIKGRVVDGDGASVPGAQIALSGATTGSQATSAEGRFEFVVIPGEHDVRVTLDGALLREFVVLIEEKNVNLGTFQGLSTLRGRAVDGDGTPLDATIVEVNGPLDLVLVTDDAGEFRAQVAPGSYELLANWQGNEAEPVGTDVELPAEADVGDVLVLQTLRGVLVDGLLEPIAGLKVLVQSTPQVVATTNASGAFAMQVPTGMHRTVISKEGMTLVDEDVGVTSLAPVDMGVKQVLARVTGRLVDEITVPNTDPPVVVSTPVAGAEVVVDTTPVTTTTSDADGTFALDVPLADYALCVALDQIFVAHALVDATGEAGNGIVALPDIVATPMPDVDGDGLGNGLETDGWQILVDEFGGGDSQTRDVVSDPFGPDADGDGLTDDEEFAFKTDPSRADTDGDLLTDVDELRVYFSQPVRVDSDGDALPLDDPNAIPNSAFFDGNEALVLRTSPVLDDSDGDGFRDREEVLEGGTNPRVANLPKIAIEVFGEPVVGFEGDVGLSQEEQQTSVANDTSASKSTKEFNFKTEGSLDTQVKAKGKKGFPGGISGSVEAEATLRASVNADYAYHTDSETTKEMSNLLETTSSFVSDFDAGKIEVAIEVRNDSDLTIRYSDLDIIAFQLDPRLGAAGLKPLGELFDPDGTSGESVLLGPQGSTTILRENRELDLLRVRDYLSNPTGLYFRIGDYSLFQLDDEGNEIVDYDVVAQNVVERTAQLTIDWGNGTTEDFLVATNLERNADGTSKGLRMAEAMALIGYDFDTALGEDTDGLDLSIVPSSQGKQLLTRVGSVSSTEEILQLFDENGVAILDENGAPIFEKSGDASRFWLVYGPGATEPFDSTPGQPPLEGDPAEVVVDFPEIRLKPGEAYLLQYVTDDDTDGLTFQQEQVYGTSDQNPDTDGDGLTDFEEVLIGWDVEFENREACGLSDAQEESLTFSVRSNPRFGDLDGDGVFDNFEKTGKTDPFAFDTDFDEEPDSTDTTNDACSFFDAQGDDPALVVSFDREDWDSIAKTFADLSGNDNAVELQTSPDIVTTLPPYGPNNRIDGAEWHHAVSSTAQVEQSVRFWNERWFVTTSSPTTLGTYAGTPSFGPNFVVRRTNEAPQNADIPKFTATATNAGWTFSVWVQPFHGGIGTQINGPLFAYSFINLPDNWNVIARQADYFHLYLSDRRITALLGEAPANLGGGGGPNNVLTGPTLSTVYYHIAVTAAYDTQADLTNFKLYVNGSVVSSAFRAGDFPNPVAPGSPGDGEITIGSWGPHLNIDNYFAPFGKGGRFNGAMDELRIYDRPLTELEVFELSAAIP